MILPLPLRKVWARSKEAPRGVEIGCSRALGANLELGCAVAPGWPLSGAQAPYLGSSDGPGPGFLPGSASVSHTEHRGLCTGVPLTGEGGRTVPGRPCRQSSEEPGAQTGLPRRDGFQDRP